MKSFLKQPFKLILILLIIAGISLRLVNLEEKIYWKDEVFTSLRVSGYTEEEVKKDLYQGQTLTLEDLQKYQKTQAFSNAIGTVYGLAKEEAQLPPLYFLIVKVWVSLFGNSVAITRSISAIFSIISCLIAYLLCRELFELKMVAWVGMTLIAVSPFHIIYSQMARPYSLWLLVSLLSSLMLLKALKFNRKLNWGLYTLTISLSLYTSPFALFGSIGHGVYVFFIERFQLNQRVKRYLISLIIGILSFSPWLLIIILRYHQIKGRTSWSSVSYSNGIIELVFNWFRNITRLFLDFDQLNYTFTYLYQNPFWVLISITPVIILVSYSIYFLCRHSQKSTWSFIIIWLVSTAFPLILADLLLGGRRSGTARYLLPSYLGIQLSVAYLLAKQSIESNTKFQQRIWQTITIMLCFLGLLLSIYISPKFLWWNNDPSRYIDNAQMIQTINNHSNSLVISDHVWDEILTLSYYLSSDVNYQLIKRYNDKKLPDNFSHYFLYKPSHKLQKQLEKNPNYQLKPAYQSDKTWLWKIE